jgi:DNA-binding transcriptional MerR regulator
VSDTPKVSTSDVAAAAGVSRATVQRWAKAGLLPLPTVYYGLKPGKHSYWDEKAPAQAAWVAAQISAGRTFEQIKAALDAGAFRP